MARLERDKANPEVLRATVSGDACWDMAVNWHNEFGPSRGMATVTHPDWQSVAIACVTQYEPDLVLINGQRLYNLMAVDERERFAFCGRLLIEVGGPYRSVTLCS